uniref:hypothetical protein n=1 Tax=Pseudomonas syringae TaxID=317 RepID=UPI00190F2F68
NGDPNDAAWVAGNVERYNAQLHKPQTTALEKLRTLNPELSDRLDDAACALSQCAASIPVDDPRYGKFKERQDRGEGYTTEIEMLQATGEFEGRSWTDRSDDFLNAHGKVVQAADASVDTASGIVGGVGSYAGMMATSPVCVGVLTCALPAGLGVLGTQQLVGAWDSASQINAGFTSDQPGRVEAAFHLDTFPGESSITKDLAANASQSVLEMSVFGLAGKYFNGLSAADEVVFPWNRESVVGPKGAATEGTFPDEVFTGKKPHQTTPGIGSVTQERYNPATGKLEKSVIEYDQYGRQVKRTDYTNHGYGNQEKPAEYHSDPHTHTYEYGPGYGSNGKETRNNND